MENLFFNTDYSNFEQALIKLLLFIAISGMLVYLLFFIFSKLLYRKSKQRREISLRLTFLWSLFVFFIVFNIYIFFIFYRIGIDNLNFASGRFYLGVISQISIYLVLIILFFIKRFSLKKIINENSLN
jgi:hypothetical protein